MIVGEKDFTDKLKKVRTLSDSQKDALICGQQYQLGQLQSHIEKLKCAHESGHCVLCSDKDQTIEDLNGTIKILRAKMYGRSSERRKKFRRKKDKKQGGDGNPLPKTRIRLPSEQYPNARIEERLVADAKPPACLECNRAMSDSGMRETSERLELIPMELFIIRMNRVRYHCKCCQSAPQTAALPVRIVPHSSLNDSVLIEASLAKFYDLIPTERFAKMLSRSSVDISDKLLLSAQHYLAQAFYSIYQALKGEVLAARVVHADESPHRMLERNEGHYSWFLWCFCTKNSVYFEIHETRAADVSIEFLKQSQALFLMSDVYSGYIRTVREINKYRKEIQREPLIATHCNDHSRRYFFWVQEEPLAEKVLDLYGKIYAIEDQVQDLIAKPSHDEPKNSKEALKLRQTMDPLYKNIYDRCTEILMDNAPSSGMGTAANYFLNNLPGLTRFMNDLSIPISNAPAERSIRNPAVGRKTWYGTHSRKGAETSAIHLSIFESCRLNQLNPREYYQHQAELLRSGQPLMTPLQYKLFMQKKQPPKPSSVQQ